MNRYFLALAAASIALGPSLAGAQGRERVDTTMTLDGGGTLSVSIHSGRVSVTGSSGSAVRIRGTMDRDGATIRGRASSVTISADEWGHSSHGSVDLDISVPIGTRVVMEGASAPFSVRGVKGDVVIESMSGRADVTDAVGKVRVETISGDITVTGVDGDVRAESVSGDIKATNIDGDLTLETVSSAISITRASSKVVRVESVQGSVTYDGTMDPAGNYSLATHSGTLTLMVPSNAGATVRLETFSGTVDSDFPVTLEAGASRLGKESEFEFRIGDGRSRVVLETFSGDIRIQRGSGRANRE
jgi:DUF4097 and DUF4098 domain-containing protein YvlB